MNILTWLGAILIFSSSCDAAAATFKWAAMALNVKDNKPIEGVEFHFELTDTKNGKVTKRTCTTPADGICTLREESSGGGFFGGAAGMNAEVCYKKEGFLELARIVWKDTSSGKTGFFVLTPVGYPEEQAALARAKEEEELRTKQAASRRGRELRARFVDACSGLAAVSR